MLDHRQFRTRYRFTGALILETALHIGTGQLSPTTESPVVRDSAGRPVIPGSSVKGAFRAAVARLAPNLGLQACDPFGADDFCVSPQRGPRHQAYLDVRRFLGRRVPPHGGGEEGERAREALRVMFDRPELVGKELTEEDLMAILAKHLCPVCQVFGSPHFAARARFDDMPALDWFEVTEIRDGVGIDRDSERAVEEIKFDFEVVPAGTVFRFGLTLENPGERDLALVAVGLREMQEGMVRLGGIRSRGLGRCILQLDPVRKLDATDRTALTSYLKAATLGEELEPAAFFKLAIQTLTGGGEG